MREFHSFLAPQMDLFRKHRKASFKWNQRYEDNLVYFSRHLEENFPEETNLNQEMVESWCRQRDLEKNKTNRSRTASVNAFIKYLNQKGLSDVKPYKQPKAEKYKPKVYHFSDEILARFYKACDALSKKPSSHKKRKDEKMRALMIPIFFRLLFSSGMRTTEARLLKRENINLETGVVSIEGTKGYVQHYIVLHDSMLEIMRKYDVAMDKLMPDREFFFTNQWGKALSTEWVSNNFRDIWKTLFPEGKSPKATAYQLRHEYCTRNINRISGSAFKNDKEMTYVQKSMGHITIQSTMLYYSITAVLGDLLEDRTNMEMEKAIGEGVYGNGQSYEIEVEAEIKAMFKRAGKVQPENLFKQEFEDDLADLIGEGVY